MRKPTTRHTVNPEHVAVRAYFAWLNGSTAGHEQDWYTAEAAQRRSDAAKRSAATRAQRAYARWEQDDIAATQTSYQQHCAEHSPALH